MRGGREGQVNGGRKKVKVHVPKLCCRSGWMDTWTFNEFDFSSYDVFLCYSLSDVRCECVFIFLLHKRVLKLSCRRGRLSHKNIGMETIVRGCNTLATENCVSAFNWLSFTV